MKLEPTCLRVPAVPGLAAALLIGMFSGCGDDPPGPVAPAGDAADDAGTDAPPPVDGVEDAGPGADVTQDGPPIPDLPDALPDLATDTSFPDLIPDTTPPTVASSSPAAGEDGVAIPFVVTVTFDELLYGPTLVAGVNGSVLLEDYEGHEVPVNLILQDDDGGTTLVLEPITDSFSHASPYTVTLSGGKIADGAGNKMAENHSFTFYTQSFGNLEVYEALAATHAPRIYADVSEGAHRAKVPTRVDLDGDWDASNNVDWLKTDATTLSPALYFDVAETVSHYYIHYMAYFPWLDADAPNEHGNGIVGSMVTVEKAHVEVAQRPVAVTTYWRTKTSEENDVYVTDESGIVGGKGVGFYDVRASYPQDVLFPDGRYQAYISATGYESCLWTHHDSAALTTCTLNDGLKASMSTLVFAYQDGDETTLHKGAAWPATLSALADEGTPIGYALVSTLGTLWPRRLAAGKGGLWGDTFNYAAGPGRPGDGALMSSRFVDPIDDLFAPYGRPVWAWRFVPGLGETASVKQGWIGVDPAWYFWIRHSSVDNDNSIIAWKDASQEGFSVTYCFNGLAHIDVRGVHPLCPE